MTRRPDGTPEPIAAPLIPLLDTTLLTNSPGEPGVGHQVATEIDSSDRIDVLMAFVRRSGIRPFEDGLGVHCRRGRPLRVLTTTYTGSTERAALDAPVRLGAHVRVSYDTTTTRLHAKSWLFHRDARLSGVDFSTAYIGSSNLTHSAQVNGLEWNVRISGARNPDVLAKIAAVFDAYWESGDFLDYDPDEFDRAIVAGSAPAAAFALSPVEITLRPFQERMLERIEVARAAGRHRNLLVAATGTGKTVIAAVNYARLRPTMPSDRLLFVAHREELLIQAQATFRHALRDGAFGELWVGGRRPTRFEHVFASIQALAANGLGHLDPGHFDVVIIDEFHHTAAPTSRSLLDRVQPRELIGLTATPERIDALPILDWFDGRITAELRLWDAVDQHYLTPFAYYGIADGVDLSEVPWQRGRGYDTEALTAVYTSDDAWARQVLLELVDHVGDLRAVRVLGSCVSVSHARFIARRFRDAGVAAVAVTGETSPAEREAALKDLEAGRIQVVFSATCSTRASTSPPSTRCSCCARPTARCCSSSSSAAVCAARRASPCAPSSTSSPTIAASSASTASTGPCSPARAPSCSARSATGSRSCRRGARSSWTRSPGSAFSTASARPCRHGGRTRSPSCARSLRRWGRRSACAASSPSRGWSSTTSTTGSGRGPTCAWPPGCR
ncbi:MAG: DEAD/DEAH box helicase family protein [Kineosporiaceae bacterium]